MIAALAVKTDRIAATLGGAAEFMLLDGPRTTRLPVAENIPLFLKKHQVRILICNGIGNCMLELLKTLRIEVIPGVDGTCQEVLRAFQSGTLRPGENYSCADHGRTCGACPGTF